MSAIVFAFPCSARRSPGCFVQTMNAFVRVQGRSSACTLGGALALLVAACSSVPTVVVAPSAQGPETGLILQGPYSLEMLRDDTGKDYLSSEIRDSRVVASAGCYMMVVKDADGSRYFFPGVRLVDGVDHELGTFVALGRKFITVEGCPRHGDCGNRQGYAWGKTEANLRSDLAPMCNGQVRVGGNPIPFETFLEYPEQGPGHPDP